MLHWTGFAFNICSAERKLMQTVAGLWPLMVLSRRGSHVKNRARAQKSGTYLQHNLWHPEHYCLFSLGKHPHTNVCVPIHDDCFFYSKEWQRTRVSRKISKVHKNHMMSNFFCTFLTLKPMMTHGAKATKNFPAHFRSMRSLKIQSITISLPSHSACPISAYEILRFLWCHPPEQAVRKRGCVLLASSLT